jgi:hypothetical protein
MKANFYKKGDQQINGLLSHLKWLLPGVFLFFGFVVLAPLQGGLDQAAPMGAYLNGNFPASAPAGNVVAQEIFTGLSWESPVVAIPFPYTNKLLVVEMDGRFFTITDLDGTATRTQVMDIQDRSWYYDWGGKW